jgi:hypothetical protein
MKDTKPTTENLTSITKLHEKIRMEQCKIDHSEGGIVASHIRLGHHLAALRTLAKKTWGSQLKAIGINPRVASRYLKIAQHWPNEIGLKESDCLTRLPVDLMKLEWLCRVPLDGLANLLGKLDCKKATRPQVIAAVREALGEDPPSKDESDVEQFVRRLVDRLTKAVDRMQEKFPEAEQQDRFRGLLAEELHKMQQTLTS